MDIKKIEKMFSEILDFIKDSPRRKGYRHNKWTDDEWRTLICCHKKKMTAKEIIKLPEFKHKTMAGIRNYLWRLENPEKGLNSESGKEIKKLLN